MRKSKAKIRLLLPDFRSFSRPPPFGRHFMFLSMIVEVQRSQIVEDFVVELTRKISGLKQSMDFSTGS